MTEAKRRLRVLTASKVKLAQLCTEFLAEGALWIEVPHEKAARGNVAHEQIQCGLEQYKAVYFANGAKQAVPAEGYFAQALAFLADYQLDQFGPMEIERSYGTQGNVGSFLGYNRDYAHCPEGTWLVGTADVVVPEECLLTVVDWKTGDATRALEQLIALGALASGGYEDTDLLRVLSVHVSQGSYKVGIDQTMSVGDARAHIEELRVRLLDGPHKVVGEHCYNEFCPHALACKGVHAQDGSVSGAPLIEEVADLSHLSDDTLLEMWTREKVRGGYAEKAMARIRTEMARRGGLRTPTGFLTETFRNVPRPNLGALTDLARRLGASDQEIADCTRVNRESAGWRTLKDK